MAQLPYPLWLAEVLQAVRAEVPQGHTVREAISDQVAADAGCCPSFVVHMSALFPVSTSGVEKPRRAGCRAGLGGHVVGGVV
ncbi:MAG: hypothetical protein ACRDRR_20135, partial [Pseudonocardiaceae bacterium]